MNDYNLVISELAFDGEVSLGRCSTNTVYRWAREINKRLDWERYDWRVKAIPKAKSLVVVPR